MLKPIVMCAPGTMKVTDVTFPLRAMGAALRCSLARPIIPAAMLVIYPVSMPPPCRADRAAERILLSNRFTTCFTAGWRPPFRWTASCQAFARRVYSAGVSKFAAVEAIVIDVDDDRVAILDESDWSAEKGLRCDVADHQAHRSARESCVHSRFGTYWERKKKGGRARIFSISYFVREESRYLSTEWITAYESVLNDIAHDMKHAVGAPSWVCRKVLVG